MPKLPTQSTTIELRYGQLEQLVGDLLDAHEDRQSPLSARFRLFRQRGFPANARKVGANRFAYDFEAVLQVTLGFWLMHAFIPQETVPIVIRDNWDEIRGAFREAFALIAKVGIEAANVDDDRKVIVLAPRNLRYLKLEKDEKVEPGDTVALKLLTARDAGERLFGDSHHRNFAPTIVIDLQRLAGWIQQAITLHRWADSEAFKAFAAG